MDKDKHVILSRKMGMSYIRLFSCLQLLITNKERTYEVKTNCGREESLEKMFAINKTLPTEIQLTEDDIRKRFIIHETK